MAKKVIPNCVEVRLHWNFGGIVGFNVLHGQKGTSAVNQALADNLFTTIAPALVSSGLAGVLHSTTLLEHIGVRDISIADQPEFISTAAGPAGTGAGNALPPQVALNVTFRSALVGRSNRGRAYQGGFADDATLASGRATPTATASLEGFWNTVHNTLNAQGLPHCIGQINLPQRTNAAGETLPARAANANVLVTSVVVIDNIFDTVRRRKT